jgi:hypothetical protein
VNWIEAEQGKVMMWAFLSFIIPLVSIKGGEYLE